MNKKDDKKFWGKPWIIAIGGTAIGTIIASIFMKVNLFVEANKWFFKLLKFLINLFTLTISIKVWALILLILSIPIIIFILALIAPKKKETISSPYNEYIKDLFDGIVFRWNWEYNKFDKRYNIKRLTPFCPNCDCQLNVSDYGELYCPSCGFKKDRISKSKSDLEILIYNNLRKKYFPTQ